METPDRYKANFLARFPDVTFDDRFQWPWRAFHQSCICKGNFFGFDCGECFYGWEGQNCDRKKPIRQRKNALHLNPAERKQFLRGLELAKTTLDPDYVILSEFLPDVRAALRANKLANFNFKPVGKYAHEASYWDIITWMHYYTTRFTYLRHGAPDTDFTKSPMSPAHGGPAFGPWHRYYLLQTEQRMQKVLNDPNFAWPYWDWTDQKTCQVCMDDLAGSMNKSDVFTPPYQWKMQDGKINKTMVGKSCNSISKLNPLSKWKSICAYDEFLPNATEESGPNGYLHSRRLCPGVEKWPQPVARAAQLDENMKKLPTKEQVAHALSFSDYYGGYGTDEKGFIHWLEDIHNGVHMNLGCTMADVRWAANDPMFFLHHANVDRYFEVWIRKYRPESVPYSCHSKEDVNNPETALPTAFITCPVGQDPDEFLAPFYPLKRLSEIFKRSDKHGYEYV